MSSLHVMFEHLDPSGLPRAYACGPVEAEEEVKALAERHLTLYREEKRKLDDPLGSAVYTVERSTHMVSVLMEDSPGTEGHGSDEWRARR